MHSGVALLATMVIAAPLIVVADPLPCVDDIVRGICKGSEPDSGTLAMPEEVRRTAAIVDEATKRCQGISSLAFQRDLDDSVTKSVLRMRQPYLEGSLTMTNSVRNAGLQRREYFTLSCVDRGAVQLFETGLTNTVCWLWLLTAQEVSRQLEEDAANSLLADAAYLTVDGLILEATAAAARQLDPSLIPLQVWQFVRPDNYGPSYTRARTRLRGSGGQRADLPASGTHEEEAGDIGDVLRSFPAHASEFTKAMTDDLAQRVNRLNLDASSRSQEYRMAVRLMLQSVKNMQAAKGVAELRELVTGE